MKHMIRMQIAALALAAVAWAQPSPAPAAAPKARHVDRRVVVIPGRGYLGVHVVDLTDELRAYFRAEKDAGVLVGSVVDRSPASSAGLRVGDVITEVDDQKIDSPWDLTRVVRKKKAGESVKVEFVRSGVKQQAFAKVEERNREVVDLRELEDLKVPIPPIPPIDIDIDEESIRGVTEYFNSPEWRAKVEKMSECGQLQQKMHQLELRMKELEKKLK